MLVGTGTCTKRERLQQDPEVDSQRRARCWKVVLLPQGRCTLSSYTLLCSTAVGDISVLRTCSTMRVISRTQDFRVPIVIVHPVDPPEFQQQPAPEVGSASFEEATGRGVAERSSDDIGEQFRAFIVP